MITHNVKIRLQPSVKANGIGKPAIITGALKTFKYGIKVKIKHMHIIIHISTRIVFIAKPLKVS
mgnify:CR=1 FL=1